MTAGLDWRDASGYVVRMKITSDYAWIDVKRGRAMLRNLVQDHGCSIPITLDGYITEDSSRDDGVSIEFQMDVKKITLGTPIPQVCHCVRCEATRKKGKAHVG